MHDAARGQSRALPDPAPMLVPIGPERSDRADDDPHPGRS